MKKLICVLLVIFFCLCTCVAIGSSYEVDQTQTEESNPNVENISQIEIADEESISTPEILFRDIPWGTGSSQVVDMFNAAGLTSVFKWEKTTIPAVDHLFETDFYSCIQNGGNTIYCYDIDVSGYDVSMTNLYFMYKVENGEIDRTTDALYSAVYSFDVTDHEVVYLSLKKKLSNLYGEGDEMKSSQKGWILAQDYSGNYKYKILETTWEGANDTFVTLRWTSSDNDAISVQEMCGIMVAYGKSNTNLQFEQLREAITEEQKKQDKENSQSNNNDGL